MMFTSFNAHFPHLRAQQNLGIANALMRRCKVCLRTNASLQGLCLIPYNWVYFFQKKKLPSNLISIIIAVERDWGISGSSQECMYTSTRNQHPANTWENSYIDERPHGLGNSQSGLVFELSLRRRAVRFIHLIVLVVRKKIPGSAAGESPTLVSLTVVITKPKIWSAEHFFSHNRLASDGLYILPRYLM